jgi:hypothetical protein
VTIPSFDPLWVNATADRLEDSRIGGLLLNGLSKNSRIKILLSAL